MSPGETACLVVKVIVEFRAKPEEYRTFGFTFSPLSRVLGAMVKATAETKGRRPLLAVKNRARAPNVRVIRHRITKTNNPVNA